MRTVYLQVQKETNIITDCISYPYSDYIKFTGEVPTGCYGGWFKLENEKIIEYPELRPQSKEETLEKRIQVLTENLAEEKINNMKKNTLAMNLTKEVANLKIEIMKLKKGGNQ